MKKKLFSTLLATSMITAALTGCGTSNTSTVTADGKVQIEFWYSGGKTAAGVLENLVQEFNNTQEDYEVITVTQADYSETYTKLQAGIAGNSAPDLALLDVDKSTNLYSKSLVANVGEFIAKDPAFEQEDYVSVFFEQGMTEAGDIFALPAYGTTQVMYYNIEIFNNAGIDPENIETWQDLAEASKIMTTEDGSVVGWEPMWGYPNLIDIALSNGASLLSEDGTQAMINSEEWVEAWENIRTWIHDDKIMKVHSGGQGWEYWYNTMDDVLQNRAGGYTGSSGDQADLDFSIVGAMEQPGFGSNPSAPTADALQYVMLENSTEEEKAGAYELMKFLTSPDNQATWSMSTGYVPVRNSTVDVKEYAAYTSENPQALVPFEQAQHGTPALVDPTGGEIFDALSIAADKIELENISAQEALDAAQKTAQAALDNL